MLLVVKFKCCNRSFPTSGNSFRQNELALFQLLGWSAEAGKLYSVLAHVHERGGSVYVYYAVQLHHDTMCTPLI